MEQLAVDRIGRYRLIRVLGEGGMGIVHLAQTPEHEWVALKLLRPHVVGDEEARARLAREVATLSRVTSDRVAAVIDADPWGEWPFVVTEYVAGPTVRDQVRECGPMPEPACWQFAAGLVEAVAAVHAVGVLHRDIKPGNVLVEDGSAVLIDFGLARLAEDPRMTATGWLLGTPGYLAPEVLHGDDATVAADVHALAATLAFTATGRPPAGSGPPMAIMDRVRRGEFDLRGVPAPLLDVIRGGLEPDPLDRPTIPELLDCFGAAVPPPPAAEPTLVISRAGAAASVAPEPPEPFERPRRRVRQQSGIAGIGLILAGVTACLPYPGAAAVALIASLLRFASMTAQRHSRRREIRGRARWYDVPTTALAAPAYLVASLIGSAVLVATACIIVAAAAFVLGAAHVRVQISVGVLAVLWVLSLWWGPGSLRVREWARRSTSRWARPTRVGPLVLLVGIGCAAAALAVMATHGPWWVPASGEPWASGWMGELSGWMR